MNGSFLLSAVLCLGAAGYGAGQRPISLNDLDRFQDVTDPQTAPDGQWVLYSASTADQDSDRR